MSDEILQLTGSLDFQGDKATDPDLFRVLVPVLGGAIAFCENELPAGFLQSPRDFEIIETRQASATQDGSPRKQAIYTFRHKR